MSAHANSAASYTQTAIFAGGCFWCMQPDFDMEDGVISTSVGYTGGSRPNPTYEEISKGTTGHYEAIRITYNPDKITYQKLLDIYWRNIDPFDAEGQFADRGPQYKTVIFYAGDDQKKIAEQSKSALATRNPGKPVATSILPAATFYEAEDYHQRYYEKNALRYNMYKHGSGRASKLKELWGEQHEP